MIKLTEKVLLVIIFSSLLISNVFAQNEQVFLGTRPLSMGEAFLAVADDGNSIYWNPAGLARMERIQLSFSYADRFGIGINSYYLSFLSRLYFIPPLTDYLTFGIDWSGINLADDEELDFNQNQFHFALGFKPPNSIPYLQDFSFGVSANHFSMLGETDGISETKVDAKGWGWNFGLLYHLEKLPYVPGKLNLGFMIHDIGATQITHDTDKKEKVLSQNIRWGLSYRPFENLPRDKIPISDPLFALDIDDRIHVGLEFWVARTFAIRAGIQKDLHTDEKMTLSFGLGIKANLKDWPGVNIDYGLTDSPVLPNTDKQFGGSIIVHEDPRLIRIEEAYIEPIFVSLYPYYGQKDPKFGSIKLRNTHKDSLTAYISFIAEDYTVEPTPEAVGIDSGKTIEYDLYALFKSNILYTKEKWLSGEVKVDYEYNRRQYSTTRKLSTAIYGKNVLTWDDPARATAFITPQDSTVQKFSQQVVRMKPEDQKLWINHRLSRALMLFEALSAYGIKYLPDPNTPFKKVEKTKYYFDTIQYPNEILMSDRLLGDCDDLSILYCSLLESVGIPTALISIRGHIFMMFDTGVPENQSYRFMDKDDNNLEFINGTIWLPIETTWIDSSLAKAWREGAELLNNAKEDTTLNLEILLVSEGWSKFEPTSPNLQPPTKFELKNLNSKINNSLVLIDTWNRNYLQKNYFSVIEQDPENFPTQNLLGILYAQNEQTERAKQQFEEILKRNPQYWPVLNNLANVHFMQAIYDSTNYDSAAQYYTEAINLNEHAAGVYLNLSLLYFSHKDSFPEGSKKYLEFEKECNAALQKAGDWLNKDISRALELFSLPEEDEETKAGISKKKLRKLCHRFKDHFYRVFKPKKKTPRPRQAGRKAGEPDIGLDLASILWWSRD